jgi:hypothetical protein
MHFELELSVNRRYIAQGRLRMRASLSVPAAHLCVLRSGQQRGCGKKLNAVIANLQVYCVFIISESDSISNIKIKKYH